MKSEVYKGKRIKREVKKEEQKAQSAFPKPLLPSHFALLPSLFVLLPFLRALSALPRVLFAYLRVLPALPKVLFAYLKVLIEDTKALKSTKNGCFPLFSTF